MNEMYESIWEMNYMA